MSTLVQIIDAVALGPLAFVAAAAWIRALTGTRNKDHLTGAAAWTVAAVVVALMVFGGGVVPWAISTALLVAGVGAGAVIGIKAVRAG